MGSAAERAKGRKELGHYFEGEKRQKKGECLFMLQAKGKDPVERGILMKRKEDARTRS